MKKKKQLVITCVIAKQKPFPENSMWEIVEKKFFRKNEEKNLHIARGVVLGIQKNTEMDRGYFSHC
jgi:hypothetical protein